KYLHLLFGFGVLLFKACFFSLTQAWERVGGLAEVDAGSGVRPARWSRSGPWFGRASPATGLCAPGGGDPWHVGQEEPRCRAGGVHLAVGPGSGRTGAAPGVPAAGGTGAGAG